MADAKLYERVAGERRRLRQVRQALTVATARGAQGDPAWVPFYIAIADYFEAAMHRLHMQDVRMGDLLRAKADMQNAANKQAMAELEERLAGNQAHLANMLTARAALQKSAVAALSQFEGAGSAYARYIVEHMGHHPGSTNMAQALFTADDWVYMADVSVADQQREQQLFDAVFALLPAGLELPD
jgi:hypothetical protein